MCEKMWRRAEMKSCKFQLKKSYKNISLSKQQFCYLFENGGWKRTDYYVSIVLTTENWWKKKLIVSVCIVTIPRNDMCLAADKKLMAFRYFFPFFQSRSLSFSLKFHLTWFHFIYQNPFYLQLGWINQRISFIWFPDSLRSSRRSI